VKHVSIDYPEKLATTLLYFLTYQGDIHTNETYQPESSNFRSRASPNIVLSSERSLLVQNLKVYGRMDSSLAIEEAKYFLQVSDTVKRRNVDEVAVYRNANSRSSRIA